MDPLKGGLGTKIGTVQPLSSWFGIEMAVDAVPKQPVPSQN
jgi:hypothetical protein